MRGGGRTPVLLARFACPIKLLDVCDARFAAVMDEYEPRSTNVSTLQGLALSTAEQMEFISVLSGDLYRLGRVCRPVLQRLDEALSAGGASYDNLISIEHVLRRLLLTTARGRRYFQM